MAGPQVTTDTIAANDNNTLLIVNMMNVTKLTASNYLMWSRQVHALLDGYNLSGFVDGSSPAPAPTITTNEVVSPNPKYVFWKRQDKLVFSALLGSITVSIQPLLSTTNTSAEIWKKLADTYDSGVKFPSCVECGLRYNRENRPNSCYAMSQCYF